MDFNKIIAFVEGNISAIEIKNIEQFILNNPEYFKIIGDLRRIQRSLEKNESLTSFFMKESKKTWSKIQNNSNSLV